MIGPVTRYRGSKDSVHNAAQPASSTAPRAVSTYAVPCAVVALFDGQHPVATKTVSSSDRHMRRYGSYYQATDTFVAPFRLTIPTAAGGRAIFSSSSESQSRYGGRRHLHCCEAIAADLLDALHRRVVDLHDGRDGNADVGAERDMAADGRNQSGARLAKE